MCFFCTGTARVLSLIFVCLNTGTDSTSYLLNNYQMGLSMRKFVLIAVAIVSALSVAGCAGKGKAPIGKGKAPVVQTRG